MSYPVPGYLSDLDYDFGDEAHNALRDFAKNLLIVQQSLSAVATVALPGLSTSAQDRAALHAQLNSLTLSFAQQVLNLNLLSMQVAAIDLSMFAPASDLTAEVGRATGVEGQLAQADATEQAARIAADQSANDALAAEISRATAAEQTNTQAVAANASAITAEKSRATTVEGTLSAAVSAEQAARQQADTSEAGARTAADQTLTTNLAGEVTRATQAEGTLTSGLAAEVSRATAAEQAAAKAAADEATRAKAAEQANAAAISSEVIRAQGAEGTLTTNLSAEATRAKGAEGTLTTNLGSEVTARQQGDSANAAAITQEITDRKAAVTAEATARTNADSAEATARQNADIAETNARAAADTALGGRIDTEVTARTSADSNEASARVTADTALGKRIDDEITARVAAAVAAMWYPPFATNAVSGPGGGADVHVMVLGRQYFVSFFVPPGSATIKAVQLETISAAGSGRTLRGGIYQDTGTGLPGTLLYGSAAVAAPSSYPTLVQWKPSTPLAVTGWLWLSVAMQGATTGNPVQCRALTGYQPGVRQSPTGQMGIGLVSASDNVTAAFAASPSVVAEGTNPVPRLTFQF